MKIKKHIFSFTIFLTLIFGLLGTYELVSKEWAIGNICPKLVGIPACYIIYTILILAFIAHAFQFRHNNKLYFIVVLIALSIAGFGSTGEIFGFAECPRTSGGIPMCFISFGLFFSLFILKIFHIKNLGYEK